MSCCQRHTTVAERSTQVVQALVDALLNDGEEVLSVREISERVGCSAPQASYAAFHLFDMDRGWKRITPTDAYVPVRERNFNTVTHRRRCQGFMVTREHLANIIRSLKEEKS